MDLTTVLGIVLGIGGILLGNMLEDGHLSSLVQFTAFLIVFGGTIGATLVSNTLQNFKYGVSLLSLAFTKDDEKRKLIIAQEIIESANLVRKESLLALEKRLRTYTSLYMQNVFRFMIDGVDPDRIKEIFEGEMDLAEERREAGAKVWMDAGGYAPTIGIIGAVLGLIHVMGNLTNTAELGKGIAVDFVATIYGVGSANLFFLPLANKIRSKTREEVLEKTMIIEGAISILSGQNPYIVEEKMRSFVQLPEKDAT